MYNRGIAQHSLPCRATAADYRTHTSAGKLSCIFWSKYHKSIQQVTPKDHSLLLKTQTLLALVISYYKRIFWSVTLPYFGWLSIKNNFTQLAISESPSVEKSQDCFTPPPRTVHIHLRHRSRATIRKYNKRIRTTFKYTLRKHIRMHHLVNLKYLIEDKCRYSRNSI